MIQNPSARHGCKNIRQRLKDQRRSRIRTYSKGEARRENDQTGYDRYKRIQDRDILCLAKDRSALAKITSENQHGTDAKAQGKND